MSLVLYFSPYNNNKNLFSHSYNDIVAPQIATKLIKAGQGKSSYISNKKEKNIKSREKYKGFGYTCNYVLSTIVYNTPLASLYLTVKLLAEVFPTDYGNNFINILSNG